VAKESGNLARGLCKTNSGDTQERPLKKSGTEKTIEKKKTKRTQKKVPERGGKGLAESPWRERVTRLPTEKSK